MVLSLGEEREAIGPSVNYMQARIGQLALENDSFGRLARSLRRCERP